MYILVYLENIFEESILYFHFFLFDVYMFKLAINYTSCDSSHRLTYWSLFAVFIKEKQTSTNS